MELIPKKWAIIPFALVHMAAMSTNLYIVPQFVIHKLCHLSFNSTVCNQLGQPKFKTQENYVFEKAAAWNALITFAGLFPATLIALPLGAMTDLVSKHRVLLIPPFAALVTCLINLCSSIFAQLHVSFLALANFATCFFGGESGFTTLCFTYAASASLDNRTLVMAIAAASVHIGGAIGNLVGNYLTRYYGFSSAFLFATISITINLLYALVLIPPVDDIKYSNAEQYDLWNGIKEHTKDTWFHLMAFTKTRILHPNDTTILLLLIAIFFDLASTDAEQALITLFLKHSPLNLKADQIGIYLTLFESSNAFFIVVLALAANRFSTLSDCILMFMGSLSKIVKYIVLSFSTTTLMVYLSTILVCFGSSVAPAVRSTITKLVPNEEYGVSLSFVGLLGSLSDVIMSPVANGLFAVTVKVYSGFSILLLGCLCMISLAIFCYVFAIKECKGTATVQYQKTSTIMNNNE